jgi:hypothetical protein
MLLMVIALAFHAMLMEIVYQHMQEINALIQFVTMTLVNRIQIAAMLAQILVFMDGTSILIA